MEQVGTHPQAALKADTSTFGERRRPGRPLEASPALIPLLRGVSQLSPDLLPEFEDSDQLRPARGLGLSVAVSLLLWALVATVWTALA